MLLKLLFNKYLKVKQKSTYSMFFLKEITLKSIFIFTFVIVTNVLPFYAFGANITSNQSGSWGTASTWSGGVVPGSSDNVTIQNGHIITTSSSITCTSLTNTGSTLTLGADFTVTGSFTINNGAVFNISSYNINIGGDLTFNNTGQKFNWTTGTVTISGNITYSNGVPGSSSGFQCTSTGYLVMNGTSKVFTLDQNTDASIPNFRLGSSTISINTQQNSRTFTISSNFDMNNQTAFTHTCANGSIINVSGTISNAGNMNITTSSNGEFKYSGGGEIASGSYYKLTTQTNSLTLPCGRTLTVTNTFTNSTTITGPTSSGPWARVVNSSSVVNSGGTFAASYISFSGAITNGSVGANIVQNDNSHTALCAVPSISTTGTLAALTTCAGTASTYSSFNVSGTYMNAAIDIAALSGFEYCLTNNGTYTSTLTVGASGTIASTPIYVRLAAGAASTYSGNIVLSSSGATSVNVATVSSTVTALPSAPTTVTPSSGTAICNGTSTNLNATSSGNTIYWYTVSSAGSNIGTSSSASNYSVSPSSNTTFYAEARTGGGCISASRSATALITVNALPAVSITGSSSICVGATTTLSPTTGGTWTSSNNGLATVTSPAGVVTAVAAGSPTFTFAQTSPACSNTTAAVTVNALPVVSITGSNPICVGATTNLSPTTGGTWTSSNAGLATVTSPAGVVTAVAAGSPTFTFAQTSPACSNTTAAVTINTLPVTSNLSATVATLCAGGSATVTVSSTSLTTGNYTVTYNVSGTNTVSSTTASMSFTSGSPGTGTFTTSALNSAGVANQVNITAIAFTATGCSSSVSISTSAFTTTAAPTPTFSAQPGASACTNTNVVYTTQSGQSSYSWTFPGTSGTDYNVISGSGTNSVTLQWLTTGSKIVGINYTTGSCSAASPTTSTATTVNLNSLSTPGTITGSSTVTQGQTGVIYSVGAITNASGYTWTLPSNASITAGSNTNSITVSYAANAANGNIYVSATNSCTSSTSSPYVTVTVAPILTAASSPTVDAAFDITFTDNSAWRAAISSITVDGSTLAVGAYNATASGKITFTPSASTFLQSSGTKTIVVIASGYVNTTVSQIINAGVANKLVMQTTPVAQSSYTASLFTTQPVVLIQDRYGNSTTSTASVSAAIGSGTWTLAGTTAKAGVNGTVTYTDLTSYCTASVTGATITFTSSGLTSVTCSTFNIPFATPRELYYTSSGGNWSVITNWKVGSCSGSVASSLPSSVDNVYLNCGSSTVTLDVTGACNNLTIANSVSLSIGASNLTVSGDLSCNSGSSGTLSNWTTGTITVSGNFSFGSGGGSLSVASTGYLVMDGTNKSLSIIGNQTIKNLRLGSNSISCNVGSANTLTISGIFDMNSKSAFTHNSGTILISGSISNSSSMSFSYTGTPTFSYTNGGTIVPGSYYNLTTTTTAATIACGSTITVNNTFTNSTTITGPNSASGWAKIVNANAISNSLTIGSSTSYLYLSGTTGGTIGGTNGVNVVQNSSNSANCLSTPTVILGSTPISSMNYCYTYGASTAQSYTVSGAKLTANIIVTAPTNFELSTSSGGAYSTSLTFTKTGSAPDAYVTPTIVYSRLKSGLSVASYGPLNITNASTGATTENLSASGNVYSNPVATSSASPNPVYNVGVLSLSGPSNMSIYRWTGPSSFTSSNQNPTITNPSTSGTYSLTVTNSNGCTATSSTAVTVNTATNYYSKTVQKLQIKTHWTTAVDGSGTNPANFTDAGQIFNIIRNDSTPITPSISGSWTVSGTGSKVIVGNGTNGCNFTIPSGSNFTGTIDVSSQGTLTISNPTTSGITVGTLSTLSTVVYSASSSQNVLSTYYDNLTLNANSVLPNGTVWIFNSLTTPTSIAGITGSTVVFCGTGSQTIPPMTYNNIQTQMGGTKTLGSGNLTINGVLTVGNITSFDASNGSRTITFAGTGGKKRIIATGTFIPNNSTVNYSVANDTVSAVNYFNLTLGNVNGVFESSDIVGIAGSFSPSGTWINTGSNIVFNGSSNQNIPVFNYNVLKVNNSSGVTLVNNTTISSKLILINGILATNSKSLTITNTAVDAVSTGSSTSFVNGALTRYLPSSASSSATYYFPIGCSTTYLPISLNNITTGAITTVTALATLANSGGIASTGLSSLSSTEFWDIQHNNTLTASVTLSRPIANPISSTSVLGHSATANGSYISIDGTANTTTNTIVNSSITSFSDIIIATSSTTAKTYIYDGMGSVESVLNWIFDANGDGSINAGEITNPTDFTNDNATYLLKNTPSVSLSSNWTISGANTSLVLGDGTPTSFTIPSGYTFQTSGNVTMNCYSTLNIASTATVTIYGNYSTSGACAGSSLPITLDNSGTLNVYGTFTQVAGTLSTVNNYGSGVMNIYNDYSKGQNTAFNNFGAMNITNGNFLSNNNSQNYFNNKNGGIVTIDNSGAPSKADNLTNIDFSNGMVLEAGSDFRLIKTNLIGSGSNALTIAGNLSIQDGNMTFNNGGGTIAVTTTGSIYLYDTDNSGDGVLNMNFGGQKITVAGIFYAEGLQIPTGGGTAVTVSNAGTMFIGNIGLYTGANNNDLVVQSGGTLNFCGNKTAGADNLGTINSGGTLNYALGYYTTQTPGGQSDFSVGGNQVAAFSDATSCMAAFDNAIANANSLPISLDYFDVKQNGEIVAIEWSTASETNNDFFTVLKSLDAIQFDIISTTNGAGTTAIKQYYNIIDEQPQIGINYYKLKQTDFDGNSTIGPVKSVNYSSRNIDFEVYPNPSKYENITIVINTKRAEELTLVIVDQKGSQVFNTVLDVEKGQKRILLIDYTYLNTGTYYISVIGNNIIQTKKVIVE